MREKAINTAVKMQTNARRQRENEIEVKDANVKERVYKSWEKITKMDEGTWFASQQAKEIAENVLLYQRNIGGWEKNIQMQNTLSAEQKEA